MSEFSNLRVAMYVSDASRDRDVTRDGATGESAGGDD